MYAPHVAFIRDFIDAATPLGSTDPKFRLTSSGGDYPLLDIEALGYKDADDPSRHLSVSLHSLLRDILGEADRAEDAKARCEELKKELAATDALISEASDFMAKVLTSEHMSASLRSDALELRDVLRSGKKYSVGRVPVSAAQYHEVADAFRSKGKIAAIKALRNTLVGCSLKEAKTAVEQEFYP